MDEDYLNIEEYGQDAVQMLEGDYEELESSKASNGPTKLLSDEEINANYLFASGTGFLLMSVVAGWQAVEYGEPAYGIFAAGTGVFGSAQIGSAIHAYRNSD